MAAHEMWCVSQAFVAVKNLLQLRTTEALVFRDYCGLDEALERMRKRLQRLKEGEDQRDYAMDLEILCREVELIYHKKLAKVATNFLDFRM